MYTSNKLVVVIPVCLFVCLSTGHLKNYGWISMKFDNHDITESDSVCKDPLSAPQ